MKRNLLIICLCIFTTAAVHAQKIIRKPAFESSNQKSLVIKQIELTDTATILSIRLNFIEGGCNGCYKITGVSLSDDSATTYETDDIYQPLRVPAELAGESVKSPEEDNSSKSSATFNGSSYNIMFSWKKKANNPHWAGAGIALASISNMDDTGADLKISKSYSFVVNPIEYCVPISHHWLLVSGAGADWTRYHFKGDTGLQEVDGITQFVPAAAGETYKSSKLLTYYITIPLLLEYQTKMQNNRTFFISGGMVGYIKCYSKSQVDVNVNGNIEKRTLGRDLNLLPVNGRLMMQTGIGDFSFYAYYSPFSLFEKGKGPDMKPIGLGIIIDF